MIDNRDIGFSCAEIWVSSGKKKNRKAESKEYSCDEKEAAQ